MLSRFEFENRGLSDEKLAISKVSVEKEEPRNELQMLMELLKSGSKDEQRMLAQALLELGQQAPNK